MLVNTTTIDWQLGDVQTSSKGIKSAAVTDKKEIPFSACSQQTINHLVRRLGRQPITIQLQFAKTFVSDVMNSSNLQ